MHKKLVVCLLVLVAMVLVPLFQVSAKAKEPAILIEGLSYTQIAPFETKIKGPVFYAQGTGTINCNGVAACKDAGLGGQAVNVQQLVRLKPDIDSDGNGLETAGWLELGAGSLPIAFKGKGTGSLTCDAGTCDLDLQLTTRTKSGGKLMFSLVALDIDHSSAGIVYDSLGGTAEYIPH